MHSGLTNQNEEEDYEYTYGCLKPIFCFSLTIVEGREPWPGCFFVAKGSFVNELQRSFFIHRKWSWSVISQPNRSKERRDSMWKSWTLMETIKELSSYETWAFPSLLVAIRNIKRGLPAINFEDCQGFHRSRVSIYSFGRLMLLI